MSDRWESLKRLFSAALERDPGERAAFLDASCAADPDLRRRVEALLASHEQAAGFMEVPAYMDALPPAKPAPEPLAPGDLLDAKYRVERRVGAGGMGIVYRVVHEGLGRAFAAKIIQTPVAGDGHFLARFRAEAEALGKLTHEHIVDVTDFGFDRARALPYLVMEYLDGESLARIIERRGALPVDEALALLTSIASAVDYAHDHDVLHRDLKPANVLVSTGPSGPCAKILDFGLAHAVDGGGVPEPTIGTPDYMAPELLRGEAPSIASDIYSFGVLSYETLFGHGPADHVSGGEPLERDALEAALRTALDRDPAARPQRASQLVALLQGAARTAACRAWRSTELPRRLALSAAIACVLAALGPQVAALPPLERLELQFVDVRLNKLRPRSPDPRILLLVLDERSLSSDPTPIVQRADQFGIDLQRVFAAGARGVAVDLLLPESWSRSQPFSRLVLNHADALTLAAYSTPSGEVIGPESVLGVATAALGPERTSSLFGFVNLDQDGDGVSRRAVISYQDVSGGQRLTLAARAAHRLGQISPAIKGNGFAGADPSRRFWIDHAVEGHQFDRVSLADLAATLASAPERFRNRLVLVGADYAGSGDEVRVPGPDGAVVSGLVMHALAAHTILAGFPIRDLTLPLALLGTGVVAALVSACVLCVAAVRHIAAFVAAIMLIQPAGAILLFHRHQILAPVVMPVIVVVMACAAAAAIRAIRPAFPPGYSLRRVCRAEPLRATRILEAL